MTDVHYLGDNRPDGTCLGLSSSEKLSFYGTTPATQPQMSNSAVATTVAVSTTSNIWGFSTSTQANAIVSLVNEIRAALVTLGLVA